MVTNFLKTTLNCSYRKYQLDGRSFFLALQGMSEIEAYMDKRSQTQQLDHVFLLKSAQLHRRSDTKNSVVNTRISILYTDLNDMT